MMLIMKMHVIVCAFSLHPGDLYPFTRKPLFIIIDSDNSSAFEVSRVLL